MQFNYAKVLLWSPYGIGQTIIFSCCSLFFLCFFFFFSLPNLSRRRLDVCHTSTHGVALVRISDAGLKPVARGSLKTQDAKVTKNRHLGSIAQLWRATSSQLRHVSTIGKNLLSSNMSSTCPHNMVNFGPLAAEIGLPVWGTPANFNSFCVLAALLHGSQVVSVSQTLWRGTEGATYDRQGDHHVGHWPTFLVKTRFAETRLCITSFRQKIDSLLQKLANVTSVAGLIAADKDLILPFFTAFLS